VPSDHHGADNQYHDASDNHDRVLDDLDTHDDPPYDRDGSQSIIDATPAVRRPQRVGGPANGQSATPPNYGEYISV